MAWTQSQLAAAFHALSPVPASLVAACVTLNAQTTPGVAVDVPATAVRDALTSTGEWGGLMVAVDPGSTASASVRAVIHNVKTLVDTAATFRTSQATIQASVKQALAVLNGAALIASGTETALEALWAGTPQPAWDGEAVIPAHLQMAQRSGLIPSTIPVA